LRDQIREHFFRDNSDIESGPALDLALDGIGRIEADRKPTAARALKGRANIAHHFEYRVRAKDFDFSRAHCGTPFLLATI
jgi:hypothetical protein